MEADDTGQQEMQKVMEIKCEVEWNEEEEEATTTSTITIKREIDGGECDVKTEISEDGNLPSNPLMVAANQFHNLKVQFDALQLDPIFCENSGNNFCLY